MRIEEYLDLQMFLLVNDLWVQVVDFSVFGVLGVFWPSFGIPLAE